jgi:oxygen-independent coproporphyrinogen-3 oxidase
MDVTLKREDFIMQYPPINLLRKEEVQGMWKGHAINLYVHLPFCIAKCGFCYYKSFVSRDIPTAYFSALMKELALYAEKYDLGNYTVNTIYLGGGTPTLMSKEQIDILFNWFHKHLKMSDRIEITCEARPGPESSKDKLRLLRERGVTRLSIGCQSLDETILKINGRNHKAGAFYQTYRDAREADILCINVDLMSGMINETEQTWIKTLTDLIRLKPDSIAVYKMQIYLNNRLYLSLREQKISTVSYDEEYRLYVMACDILKDNGYIMCDHFSFVSAEQYLHQHRLRVWDCEDMLGIGLSSHSCFNGYLFQNDANLEKYSSMIGDGLLPISRAYRMSPREKMIQKIVFGLKLTHINRKSFYDQFGVDVLQVDAFAEIFKALAADHLVEVHEDAIKTSFTGSLYADDIARKFYLPEHKEMMLGHVSWA